MERFDEEEIEEPVSPTGQYCNSSALSMYVLGVLETEVPIDESPAKPLLQNLLLPVNPRFSSIMVTDRNGDKKWKKVEVKLEDHIKIPIFPSAKSSNFLYDEYVDEYMSKLALEHVPQNRPLWELHIIKYPTSNAKGTLVFKIHHALGDGFSLMGTLLSCMQRADNTSLPFTLPSNRKPRSIPNSTNAFVKRFPSIISLAYQTISDFGWSFLKSSLIEDDQTPIRSCAEDTKLRQITISSVSFSLDLIKEVKSKLKVTINDVLAGIVFFGVRLYMHKIDPKWSKTQSTALVVLNTRNIGGYSSVKEMLDTNSSGPWGNRFAFLHIPIPNLSDSKYVNPLEFIWDAHKETARMKNSLATPLTALFLDMLRKLRGFEAAARYFHRTLRNSSLVITNLIGPVEQMAVANLPVNGFYFMVAGSPESLTITIMSYMGKIRIAFGAEKDFIDKKLFKSCLENSFEMIRETARKI